MTIKALQKKVFDYLTEKGIDKSRIIKNSNESFLAEGKSYPSNIVVLNDYKKIVEFYIIQTKGVSSNDVKKHNGRFEKFLRGLPNRTKDSDTPTGYLVTYDSKKKDFDLFLITDEINSLSAYVNVVLKLSRLNDEYTNFYRGQGSTDFSLLPSLYRKGGLAATETYMYKEAIRRCPENFADTTSTFQNLVKLQHYGIPTRLLDLTSNALIALYFAVEKKEYANTKKKKIFRDGVVYVFTMKNTDIKAYDSDTISILSNLARVKEFNMPKPPIDSDSFNQSDEMNLLLHEIKCEKPHFQALVNPKDIQNTFCVKPKLDNSRIRQQSGAFFIYGIGQNKATCAPLQAHPINIVIDNKYKDKLKKELACFGITDAYVYPEMDHVMKDIKNELKI